MEQVRLYLDAIEEINRIERALARRKDGVDRSAALDSAIDAARAAWLNVPAVWQAKLEPPPKLEG
jgi:hypothetical protein